MFEIEVDSNTPLDVFYQTLNSQLAALLYDERDMICNAAQFSAFVMQTIPELNWAGFYFARDKQLVLGPYVGKVACTRIPFGRGVCGAAAHSQQTQRVEDVHAFEGHIACDSASASEVVIPIVYEGDLIGVFDIDSPKVRRFSQADQEGLEALVTTFIESTDLEWSF
ncbi:Free methionine-R-sulfoxide reductase [Marinomonas spartinae]|uniref:GAF domain-containing protein n=1 Tax=Marinomonas spartinae TaxID=1792290 RepID=UPI000808CB8A|nr:GAF domain-containing protein [Marinomonas spartinae]SBS25219.1 Free methionine-R-sulfoxide reductase [Marinomonas spartinae]